MSKAKNKSSNPTKVWAMDYSCVFLLITYTYWLVVWVVEGRALTGLAYKQWQEQQRKDGKSRCVEARSTTHQNEVLCRMFVCRAEGTAKARARDDSAHSEQCSARSGL